MKLYKRTRSPSTSRSLARVFDLVMPVLLVAASAIVIGIILFFMFFFSPPA